MRPASLNSISIAWFILKLIAFSNQNKLTKEERIVRSSLLGHSFRLGKVGNRSVFLPLKYWVKCVLSAITLAKRKVEIKSEKLALFDAKKEQFEQRQKFVKYFGGLDINRGYFREELFAPADFANRIDYLIGLLILFPLVFIPRKGENSGVSMLFSQLLEDVTLIQQVKKDGLTELYMFNIFETDSNLIAYLLKGSVHITKVPSEVPLVFHNKNLIADRLVICNSYQVDELSQYSETISIKEKTALWGPEKSYDKIELYQSQRVNPDYKLGYYSTGAWIRALENHHEGAEKEAEEHRALELTSKHAIELGVTEVLIFLHPREKSSRYKELSVKRYQDLAEELRIRFVLDDKESSRSFQKADIGIASVSTIMYERLFFGFKCLILPDRLSDYPINSSNFSRICPKTESEFREKLALCMRQTNEEYLEYYGLRDYKSELLK